MKPIRIYISCNELLNTRTSLLHIITKIRSSLLKNEKIIIVHSKGWIPYDFLSGLNIEYVDSGLDTSAYEFPAIRKIWQDSNELDFYGLYLHCKGSSKTDILELDNGLRWASLMMYGLIDNGITCLHHLNMGADLVGSMWYWHFKGNFFWFNSGYVKQLVDPYEMDVSCRYNCEFWPSFAYWWNKYILPKIKNLFYVEHSFVSSEGKILYDVFTNIKELPKLSQKIILQGNLQEFLNKNDYIAFDIINITNAEFVEHRSIIKRYLNYDGYVLDTDEKKVHTYDDL